MANLGMTYDVNDLPESTGYDPLPAGWYSATIADAEIRSTKSGTGQYIKLRYDITGPTMQGRVVFGNLNIQNASAKAEEIGRQQLGDIMRAIGLAKVTDTDQLIGGTLQIKVDVRPASDQYPAQNEVKGFKSIEGSALPSAAPAAKPAASSKTAPPWAKK